MLPLRGLPSGLEGVRLQGGRRGDWPGVRTLPLRPDSSQLLLSGGSVKGAVARGVENNGFRNGFGYQAIFVDTPGSQKPRDTLRARMQEQVVDSLSESDVILLLFDALQASEGLGSGDRFVARLVASSGTPAIVSINKTDLLRTPESALPIVEEVSELGE